MAETKINVVDVTDGKIKEHTKLHLAFDGSCEPKNPGGVASIGWLISDDKGMLLARGAQVVADGGELATNNFAEYCALGYPLRWLKEMGWRGELSIQGDSQLVIKQVSREWKCNAEHLKKLRARIWDLFMELNLTQNHNLALTWVPREENEEADALGRTAYEGYCKRNNKPVKYMTKPPKKEKRVYIIYDSRGVADPDEATALETCESPPDPNDAQKEYGPCCCYSYKQNGDQLIDQQFEWGAGA